MHVIGTPALWIGFAATVVCAMALDLGVLNRRAHDVSLKEAGVLSVLWLVVAGSFAGFILWHSGQQPALEFVTAYLIEEALSVDNLFVFVVLFSFFNVPSSSQHRVLFWGILGAMVFRAAFIFAGNALVSHFVWVMYVFGAVLVWTAVKLVTTKENGEADPSRHPLYRILKLVIDKVVPVTNEQRGANIFVRENGRLYATPLFLVLIAIETTDIVFAIDSVPAAFGVTRDPYIIYTSNIFAILGLRAMYFVLASFMQRFAYLRYGLAVVLAFVGGKMLVEFFDIHISTWVSLVVIAMSIVISGFASLLATRGARHQSKNASQNATRRTGTTQDT